VTPVPTGVQLSYATTTGEASGFTRLATGLTEHRPDGTVLAELRLPGAAVEVEWLYPFSWDHGDRGVITATRQLGPGDRLCLHAGPYGTADAAAHRDGVPMAFPVTGDGHRYRPDSVDPPAADGGHQDAAAWLVARVADSSLCLAWEYSGHLVTTAEVVGDEVVITTLLPADTFAPASDRRTGPGPTGWLRVAPGDLDTGAAALRRLITTEMITRPDLSALPGAPRFPCLVANSWGVQENTSTARILGMMDATATVGAEVFVVDKGWERAVGDWHANDRFPSGLASLSREARQRGMGFGVWCGWGNADPRSPVALQHPDWLATWRGHIPVLSFDNHALCLGHEPARDWVLAELTRMITDDGLDWLLHDFETIARCDAAHHSHDPGAGEHAAEAAFHHILRTLAARFPQLVLENCWNGVRPLDLAMIRSHHTTITEDHCRTHPNSLAKTGLGRYLPLDWQSAYMGTDDREGRARFAPYVIGGPWVLMDDPEIWTEQNRIELARAAEVFKRWRSVLRDGRVSRPAASPDEVDTVLGVAADGCALLAVSAAGGTDGEVSNVTVDCRLVGRHLVRDEWSGAEVERDLDGSPLSIDLTGGGALVSLVPVRTTRTP
jgi:hypothetical protein